MDTKSQSRKIGQLIPGFFSYTIKLMLIMIFKMHDKDFYAGAVCK